MRAHQKAFALIELIVAVALAGLVATIAVGTITQQQRFYRASAELRAAREGVRDAMEILSADIRGASISDTVTLRADSAIELFAAIGASVVCQLAGSSIQLPPSHAIGNSLSAFLTEPDTGDIALFYLDTAGGRWERYRISSFSSRSATSPCGNGSAFASDADGTGFALSVATPISASVKPGASVRFIRRVRYSLYRAGDGGYYLGYRRCNTLGPSVCGAIQPISGPYRAYSSDQRRTGLLLEYFDVRGAPLAPTASPAMLARVVVTARSESSQPDPFSRRPGSIADSATVSITLRNGARE